MGQKLGQHFLINKSMVKRIAGALDIKGGETIIEIGPGHGELTDFLNKELRIMNYGTKVIAIEKDPRFVSFLRKKFGNVENLEIIESDVRKILPNLTYNLKLETYKLVGNIPYYLTGYLFRILSELENKPEKCVFMVQKEVAERMAAEPPRMNRFAAIVQFWAEPKILMNVPKENFRPRPEVESAVISLSSKTSAKNSEEQEKYYRAVRILFQQPRKTILNNISQKIKDISKEKIIPVLKEMKINPQDRPQNLKIDDIIKLSGLF